jgi:hypothetical protein
MSAETQFGEHLSARIARGLQPPGQTTVAVGGDDGHHGFGSDRRERVTMTAARPRNLNVRDVAMNPARSDGPIRKSVAA